MRKKFKETLLAYGLILAFLWPEITAALIVIGLSALISIGGK